MDAGAATFRFNFGADADDAAAPLPPPADADGDAASEAAPARELFPSLESPLGSLSWRGEEVPIGADGLTLLKADGVMVAAAAAALDGGVTASDLVPGRYEGGLKLWECAVDLAGFLSGSGGGGAAAGSGGADAAPPEAPPALSGARVLELGCGHGLPGVLAALRGAASVTFQDFNAEVLTVLTAPNAAANLARSSSRGDAGAAAPPALRFVAGDWGCMAALLPAASYDVILTADTIYAPATQRRLLALIRHCLAPRGVALVAAKSYYFGVGGRTADFAAAAAGGGALRVRTVARFRDGVSNVREILRLEHAAEAAA